MLENLQLVLVGAAAVLDTLLLLALSNRRNWIYAAYSVLFLAIGTWLWHAGALALLLVSDLHGDWTLGLIWLCRLTMVSGLLLMPSAMWHAVLQVEQLVGKQRDVPATASLRQSWAYLPMLGVVPAAVWLVGTPPGNFLRLVRPVMIPYLSWLLVVNAVAAWKFYTLRRRVRVPGGKQFFLALSLTLVGMTGSILYISFGALRAWPESAALWLLLLLLSPLPLSLVFLYFVVRHNLMRLALRRSLVYGGVVIGVWLTSRLGFEAIVGFAGEEHRFSLQVIQGFVIVGLILAYPPFRERTADALSYLMGSAGRQVRQRSQTLALELSSQAVKAPAEALRWFVDEVPRVMGLEYAAAWLLDANGQVLIRSGMTDRWRDPRVLDTYGALIAENRSHFTRHDAPHETVLEGMEQAKSSLVILLARPGIQGILLFGRRSRNREPSDEEVSALLLLAEQLCVTMNAGRLNAERLIAERRAQQNEKLSALGLLAGSIAHEVKNPLSSIRTIAAVLAEDLGPDSPHGEDLRMIVSEVDRLAATTKELLQFARPSRAGDGWVSLGVVLEGTLRMLRHVAKEWQVTLDSSSGFPLGELSYKEDAIREILFNLISNAIDAASPGGRVTTSCQREGDTLLLIIEDNGPGISEDIRETLFEPFVTTKEQGTGLGLHVVNRRARELGGTIECESQPGVGTRFLLRLPIDETASSTRFAETDDSLSNEDHAESCREP